MSTEPVSARNLSIAGGAAPADTLPKAGSEGARGPAREGLDELAALAARGDRSAVNRLLAYLQPMIQRYCRARIGRNAGGYEAADDIAQDACLAIFHALPGYSGKDFAFNALAYRIASNKVADHYRRRATNRSTSMENPPDPGDSVPTPESVLLERELHRTLRRLLDILGDREREIVTLRLVVGMSAEETAEAVGSTRGAVRVAQHRAVGKLRDAVAVRRPGPQVDIWPRLAQR